MVPRTAPVRVGEWRAAKLLCGHTKRKMSAPFISRSNMKAIQKDDSLPFVLPGDNVTAWIQGEGTIKLGTGLRSSADDQPTVHATLAGQLTHQSNNKSSTYYIQTNDDGRYHPLLHDRVVGIVEDRLGSDGAGGDLYRVAIGAGHAATLSNLSFEGATKRNKPQLQPGQVVYARVVALPAHLDTELSCILGPLDVGQGLTRRDWMTDEGCYGILQGGTILRVSHDWTRRVLLPNIQNVVWQELSRSASVLPGEVAVGVNGTIWMQSASSPATVLMYNILRNAPVLTEAQTRAMIRQMVTHYRKQQEQKLVEG